MAINILDHCVLYTPMETYCNKIYKILDDNFFITLNATITPLEEKKNHTMFLDLKTGHLTFEPTNKSHKNVITGTKVTLVHYLLQVPAWIIFNSLIHEKKIMRSTFESFYDYIFGPLLTSIIFLQHKDVIYYSDIPQIYFDAIPIITLTTSDDE